MKLPSLKLTIVQGPRANETLEFKPGSTIRLGRIVRGNNVTIKDDGISSKHLIIACESAKWTIQDLDSSNGTTLNSTKLRPNTPVEIHDNDTIKIGEYTSMLVEIVTENLDESIKPRRNPRRQAATRVTRSQKNEVVVENSGLLGCEVIETESIITRKGKGRGRRKKEIPPESSEVETDAKEIVKSEQMPRQSHEVQIQNLKSEQMLPDSNEVEFGSKDNLKSGQMPPANNDVQIDDEQTMKSGEAIDRDIKRRSSGIIKDIEGDLQGMTLGEWFDYLEVYLPKQIIKVTEEMIERMRTNADRVHQYMIDQKNISRSARL